jgi:hypothetical protein
VSNKAGTVLPCKGFPLREKDLVTVLTMISGFLGLKFVESWSVSRSAEGYL